MNILKRGVRFAICWDERGVFIVFIVYIKKPPQKGGAIASTAPPPPSDGHGIFDDKKQLRPIYLSLNLMGFFSDFGHFTESVMGRLGKMTQVRKEAHNMAQDSRDRYIGLELK